MITSRNVIVITSLALIVGGGGVTWRALHRTAPIQPAEEQPAPPALFAHLPEDPSMDQLLERIHGLGRNIPLEEQKALCAWITAPKPAYVKDERAWHWLVNDAMNKLCEQDPPMPGLTDVMLGIYWKNSDPVQRDYVIQHLVHWLQPVNAGDLHETNPQKREAIVAAMLDAAGQPREFFSGTALQGLHHILLAQSAAQLASLTAVTQSAPDSAQSSPAFLPVSFTEEQLRPVVLRTAASPQASMQSRITALQICAQRAFLEALPTARQIAMDEQTPASLRVSAIAALGLLGTADDKLLLESLQTRRNAQLLRAVNPALQRLKARNISS